MADDIGTGPFKMNKKMLLISGAAAAGIIGYAYYRRKQNAAATPAQSSDTATQGTGSDQSIDPSTGVPWADEMSGYGGYYGNTGQSIYDPATGSTLGTGYGTVVTSSNNPAWAQASEAYLSSLGYDPASVAAAIGKALTGQPMTDTQIAMFDAARAFEGEPPQGHPPIIHQNPGGGGSGSGSGSGGGTPGHNLHAPSGVHASTIGKTSATITWNAVGGAISYVAYERGFGTAIAESHGTSVVLHNLRPNTSYHISIAGVGSDGNTGAHSSAITLKTKR